VEISATMAEFKHRSHTGWFALRTIVQLLPQTPQVACDQQDFSASDTFIQHLFV
jgi:hypothetical protein